MAALLYRLRRVTFRRRRYVQLEWDRAGGAAVRLGSWPHQHSQLPPRRGPEAGRAASLRRLPAGGGISLEPAGPVPGAVAGSPVAGLPPALAVTTLAAAQYATGRLGSAVGGGLVEVVDDGANPRWLVGDTGGKALPAVWLASVAATSFRDACAQPGLSLPEVARAVDLSVTRAAGGEDFVTAVFAELDPRGWIQLVVCGHPPPLRLRADGGLGPLAPSVFATPLGLHPDLRLSAFSVRTGDRILFFTSGLLQARDRAGRPFRLDEQAESLRRRGPQAAVDELLDRLRSPTGRWLGDDVAVLLAELIPAGSRLRPAPLSEPGTCPAWTR